MQLSDLDNDCLLAIVDSCSANPRTLYQLLQVSQTWFSLVIPTLYRSSLLDPTLSEFSRNRLEYILGLNSGYIHAVFGDKAAHPPFWKTPPTLPTTINYFAHVREMKLAQILSQWWTTEFNSNSVRNRDDNNLDLEGNSDHGLVRESEWNQTFRHHIEYHSSKLGSTIRVVKEQLPVMLEFISNLPQLTRLNFSDDEQMHLDNSHDPSFTEKEQEMIRAIVIKHIELFPGKLRAIKLANRNGLLWDFYLSLLNILESQRHGGGIIKELTVDVCKAVNLSELSYEHVTSVNLILREVIKNDIHFDPSEFLSKYRKADSFHVQTRNTDISKWAKLEREQQSVYQKEEKRRLELYPHELGKEAPRPLISIKNLWYSGPKDSIRDVVFGFRDTLETLELVDTLLTPGFIDPNPVRRWFFQLPNLVSLTIDVFVFELDYLKQTCPRLKKLKVREPTHFGSGNCQPVPDLPPLLEELSLKTDHSFGLSLSTFKSLIHLKTLFISITRLLPTKNRENYKQVQLENGWLFPNLQKVQLQGIFAVLFQGSLVRVSPKLEKLSLDFDRHSFSAPDLESFVPMTIATSGVGTPFAGYQHHNLKELVLSRFSIPKSRHSTSDYEPENLVRNNGPFPNLVKIEFDKYAWRSVIKMEETILNGMCHSKLAWFKNNNNIFDMSNIQFERKTNLNLIPWQDTEGKRNYRTEGKSDTGCILQFDDKFYRLDLTK